MKYKYRLRCDYCGVDDYRERLPSKADDWRCRHCYHDKYDVKKMDEGDHNPFGYPEEEDHDIKKWYDMFKD